LSVFDPQGANERREWTVVARGGLAILSGAAILACGQAAYLALTMRIPTVPEFPGPAPWRQRAGALSAVVASATLGAAALYILVRDLRSRRRGFERETETTMAEVVAPPHALDPRPRVLIPWSLAAPTMFCLLGAAGALIERAVEPSFTGGSIGERIANASSRLDVVSLVLIAFAVVALVVVGDRHDLRAGAIRFVALTASCIGVLVVIAAAYSVWRNATADSDAGLAQFVVPGGWGRASAICSALASATLGIATSAVTWRLQLGEYVDGTHAGADTNEARAPRFGRAGAREILTSSAPVVGAGLALAAVGEAIFVVISVSSQGGPFAVGDLVANFGFLVLYAVGLALGSVVVMTAARTTRSSTVEWTPAEIGAALVALAGLGTAGYSVLYVTLLRHRGSAADSFASQPHEYIATAIAYGLVALGTLSMLWRAHQPLAEPGIEDDGDGAVRVVELQPS
jgi:hypothetical protein